MSIFATQGFTGTLQSLSHKGGDPTIVKLKIKHVYEGELQNFLDSMEKTLNIKNITKLFENPILWDKLVLDSDINHAVGIEFDAVAFDAYLSGISITRKFRKDTEVYEYMLEFEKDVATDNLDKTLAIEYLNRKEENDDGKKVPVLYQIKLVLKKDKQEDEGIN
jgi:hypothetical protein